MRSSSRTKISRVLESSTALSVMIKSATSKDNSVLVLRNRQSWWDKKLLCSKANVQLKIYSVSLTQLVRDSKKSLSKVFTKTGLNNISYDKVTNPFKIQNLYKMINQLKI